MSPILVAFLKSAALPSVIVAGVAVLSGWTKSERMRGWIQSVAFAAGFVLGSYLLLDRLALPPHDFSESLSLVALLLATFTFVAPNRTGLRYLVRAVYVAAVGILLLWHLRESMDSMVHKRNALAFFFLGLGLWSIGERSAGKISVPGQIALPLVSAVSLSLMLLFKGSASLSQQATTLCALFGGLGVISLVWPLRIATNALRPFLSVFVVAFMVGGHFYLDINPWHMVFLALPYLILWVRPALAFVPKAPLLEALVLTILAIVPLAYFLYDVYKSSGPLY
jgi:hypothetical protein